MFDSEGRTTNVMKCLPAERIIHLDADTPVRKKTCERYGMPTSKVTPLLPRLNYGPYRVPEDRILI